LPASLPRRGAATHGAPTSGMSDRGGTPCIGVSGVVHDGGDDEDAGQVDNDGRPVRACIQCREPVTFDGQPGEATCSACGVRQHLTTPSRLYPTGGTGRWA
jgi:hypothetical protein